MTQIAFYTEDGELTHSVRCPITDLVHYSNYILLDDSEILIKDTFFIPNVKSPVKIRLPEKPSHYHEYDYKKKEWILSDAVKEEIKLTQQETVKLTANNTSNEPILFEGKLIDADVNARENIRNTIDRLTYEQEQGIFSGNLFWIDAENNSLDWFEASVYLAWLKRLHIAIANRKTGLVLTAKAEKDHIKTANAADLVMVKAKGKG